MMKKIALFLCLIFSCLCAKGQTLAQFKAEEGIERGTLPCGADYYLIHNEKDMGHADFALVQKNHQKVTAARKSLLSSGGFSRNPYEFFSERGVSCGKKGFVSFHDGSTIYHFHRVPTYDSAASDSTLLVLFDMMRSCPTGQAIIVSGDIQVSVVAERLRMLSLTVDKLWPAPQTPYYQWNPSEKLEVGTATNNTDGTAKISLCFHSKRTDKEAMNTPLPLVSRMFAREMEIILKNRLSISFYKSGIPLTEVRLRYRGSETGLGDELYTLSFNTSSDCLESAVGKVSFELGLLNSKGASVEEYEDARKDFLYEIGALKPRDDNASYVLKCTRHYLYGASLASEKTLSEFFANRRLPLETELELFNNFVAALLSPDKAAELKISSPAKCPSEKKLSALVAGAWGKALTDTSSAAVSYGADTAAFVSPKYRVKLKYEKKDIISGGTEWTFSNGMKVIFKKVENASRINYGMLLRGGITGVPSIQPGEAGFVQDMPGLFKVAGLSAMEFQAMLSANGIRLSTQAGLSDLRISGSAPAEKLPLLLRTLSAFAGKREVDNDAFKYYKECEKLILDCRKHSIAGIDDVEQNVIFPDYKYKSAKDLSALGDDLPLRTDIYMKSLFNKANDGVIVIVGNVEAADLAKLLGRNLYGFTTSELVSAKPKIREGKKAGWRTRYQEADINAVKVRTSVAVPYSGASALAFDVAKTVISNKLVACLAPLGYYAEIKSSTEFYPTESFHLSVVCRPVDADGLPYGISPANSNKVLQAIRKAFIESVKAPIPANDLKAYKEESIYHSKEWKSQPEGILDAVFTRVSFGKNVSSIKTEDINAVSEESIKAIISGLSSGTRIETVLQAE